MASVPGNNGMTTQPGVNAMATGHGNAAYLNSQMAAALKQQQQQQYMQRQLMVEQVTTLTQ